MNYYFVKLKNCHQFACIVDCTRNSLEKMLHGKIFDELMQIRMESRKQSTKI